MKQHQSMFASTAAPLITHFTGSCVVLNDIVDRNLELVLCFDA